MNKILKNTDWLNDERVTFIMNFLNDNGSKDQTRYVGGCVRNAILGFAVDDIDMATLLTPEQVIELCEANDIKVVPTGLKHGTVTVIYKGKPFEVTTLRKDIETDGRHAEIEYTTSWVEDSKRRDFTMNALYMDHTGQIHDYHDGLNDIKTQHVKFVGEAERRIKEDALRILRFYRFSLYYGDGGYDEIGQEACRQNAAMIKGLSVERIRDEILKILRHDNHQQALIMMEDADIVVQLPITLAAENVPYVPINDDLDQAHFKLRNLVGLAIDPKEIFEAYRLSKQQYYDLKDFDKAYAALKEGQTILYCCYHFGKIATAHAIATLYPTIIERYMADVKTTDLKTFPVTGKVLASQGVKAGKGMGDMIKACESWWLSHKMQPDLNACLLYIKENL